MVFEVVLVIDQFVAGGAATVIDSAATEIGKAAVFRVESAIVLEVVVVVEACCYRCSCYRSIQVVALERDEE